MSYTEFTEQIISVISSIPRGKVLSYGRVAALAGNSRGARQVARVLHTLTRKHGLPWYRVVNSKGEIALKDPLGIAEQRGRLEAEGVEFDERGRVEFSRFLWVPAEEEF